MTDKIDKRTRTLRRFTSVRFGDLSVPSRGFSFKQLGEIAMKLKLEIEISQEVEDKLEKVRCRHIDALSIISDELEEIVPEIICEICDMEVSYA